MNKRDFSSEPHLDLNDNDWLLSRKKFIRLMVLSGVAVQLPWLQSCAVDADDEPVGDTSPLSVSQFKTIRAVQKTLFPDDGNGPGAAQINADGYLLWVLRDAAIDPEEIDYMRKRADQFAQACKEKTGSDFLSLSEVDQLQFVTHTATRDWGDKWLSRLLTLILEALLLDPAYGGNTNKVGWKWLEHNPGLPRPKKELLYPAILKFYEV